MDYIWKDKCAQTHKYTHRLKRFIALKASQKLYHLMVKDKKEKTTTRKLMFIHREIVSRWKGKPFWFQLHSSTFMNFREMKNKPFSYSSSLFKRPFIFPSCDFIWPWFAVLRCCQSTCTPATRPLIRLLQCIYPGSSLWSFLGRSVCLRSTNAMGKYMGNQYLDTCTHTWKQAAAKVICGKYKMQHAWKSVFWFAVHLRGGSTIHTCLLSVAVWLHWSKFKV